MPEVQLFVGNVPYDVTSSQLHELLSRVATVTAVFVPTDRLTGKPRGFAIVEVPTRRTLGRTKDPIYQKSRGTPALYD